MVLTAAFLLVLVALLAGLGRAVRRPGPPLDVEPRLARDAASGIDVLHRIGVENSLRVEGYIRELHGCPPHAA